jgi:hypothetical protein
MTADMPARRTDQAVAPQRIALVDLLDRVLATGVVVTGDVTISIADVDLVYISLQALISSVRAGGPGPIPAERRRPDSGTNGGAGGAP